VCERAVFCQESAVYVVEGQADSAAFDLHGFV
jgi:hypothetical protein